jgi:hypothetical protein
MIGKFSAYLDVFKISLTNYLYGLRAFHSWLKSEGTARPLKKLKEDHCLRAAAITMKDRELTVLYAGLLRGE